MPDRPPCGRPGPWIGFAPRLAALYAALFVFSGVQLPFFPVWLKAKGLDPPLIGLVLAVPMLVRVFAHPVRRARSRPARRAAHGDRDLPPASASPASCWSGCRRARSPSSLTYALASLRYTPVMPLTETYALKGLAARGRAYGPVRLWGSVAFIARHLRRRALPPTSCRRGI